MKRTLVCAAVVLSLLVGAAPADAKVPPYVKCLRHAIIDLGMTRTEAMIYCRSRI